MWSWLAIGLSGMYSVLGAKQANPTQSLVFKIFTLLLLLILVLTQGPSADHSYWIAGGLVVSMFADTLHSFKTRTFLLMHSLLLLSFTNVSQSSARRFQYTGRVLFANWS